MKKVEKKSKMSGRSPHEEPHEKMGAKSMMKQKSKKGKHSKSGRSE